MTEHALHFWRVDLSKIEEKNLVDYHTLPLWLWIPAKYECSNYSSKDVFSWDGLCFVPSSTEIW